ncbi:MAG: inorganic phosphate transporter [Oleiphilaceae bacterium]|nr:inorganic phosphate transporter [Oleiphilaceae bacterium]
MSNLKDLETAIADQRKEWARLSLSVLFLIGVFAYVWIWQQTGSGHMLLCIAAVIGAYMAMNIGANDVANNVGPAVGSKAVSLLGAICIAAVFEAMGAIVAGGDVVSTIKKGIINPEEIKETSHFIWLMVSALLAGALWLNFATFIGAPVSTTHSIVGGVLGAGIAAGGLAIANWNKMAAIAASWVISPVLGGLIAAAFLYFIKRKILYQSDTLAAAKRYVPLLLAVMAWAFSTYLMLKGLKKIWKLDFTTAALLGLAVAAMIFAMVRPMIAKKSAMLTNNRKGVNALFTLPLIFAAALLSFAHGANDVANAVGPLAAIYDSITNLGISTKASIPMWVMLVGALGISLGLLLFGPKLIKTVGSEITELDKTRAFCVAMAAAITVIIASQLGLPVSSTHIAVGGIFGVGFLREFLKTRYATQLHEILDQHEGEERERLSKFLENFQAASVEEMKELLVKAKENKKELGLKKKDRKALKRMYSEKLVQRSALKKIVAAWVITVPVSGGLAGGLFLLLHQIPILD